MDHPQLGIAQRHFIQDGTAAIGAAIVRDDDLIVIRHLTQGHQGRQDHTGDRPRVVEGRENGADFEGRTEPWEADPIVMVFVQRPRHQPEREADPRHPGGFKPQYKAEDPLQHTQLDGQVGGCGARRQDLLGQPLDQDQREEDGVGVGTVAHPQSVSLQQVCDACDREAPRRMNRGIVPAAQPVIGRQAQQDMAAGNEDPRAIPSRRSQPRPRRGSTGRRNW